MHFLSRFCAVSLIGLSTSVFACDPKHPEDFSAFFTRFADDKAFAVSRTDYPSGRIRYEYGIEDGKQQIMERRQKVTKQEDMKYLPLGHYMKYLGLESRTQEVSPTAWVVEVFKPGVDGLLSYHFSSRRGCWFLREIESHSL
jgi:hypothetical protein